MHVDWSNVCTSADLCACQIITLVSQLLSNVLTTYQWPQVVEEEELRKAEQDFKVSVSQAKHHTLLLCRTIGASTRTHALKYCIEINAWVLVLVPIILQPP